MSPNVKLVNVCRDDVRRLTWLAQDPVVSKSCYGADEHGEPLNICYPPKGLPYEPDNRWEEAFDTATTKKIWVVTDQVDHIGNAQLVLERLLPEPQVFISIGRNDQGCHGHGTSAIIQLLDVAFYTHGLRYTGIDVSQYNQPTPDICERLRCVLGGHLGGTDLNDGESYDFLSIDLLFNDYVHRRSKAPEDTWESAG